MREKLLPVIGIICAAVLMLPAVLLGYHMGRDSSGTAPAEALAEPSPEPAAFQGTPAPDGTITIPGFEEIQLTATPGPQAMPFYNPAGNTCYFIVSLLMPDGTEVFRSGLLSPGNTVPSGELSHTPSAGVYENAVLRYSCYALNTMEALNGADVTLTVKFI